MDIGECLPSQFVPLALALAPVLALESLPVLPSGVSTIAMGACASESDRDSTGDYHQTNTHDTIECNATKKAGVVKQSK